MKMKKMYAMLLVFALISCLFAACSINTPVGDVRDIVNPAANHEDPDERYIEPVVKNEEDTDSEPKIKPKSVVAAEEAARLILDGKWDDLLQFVDVEDATFLSGSDLEWYMPRSDYKALLDIDAYESLAGEILDEISTYALVNVAITFSDDTTDSVTIPVRLNNDNKWGLDVDDFFISDWVIKSTGGDVELYVNGVLADKKYQDGKLGNYGLYDKWIIPAIGKNTAKLELKSDAFDTYTVEELPSYNLGDEKKYVSMIAEGNDETTAAVHKVIKDLWNNSYSDWVAGKTAAECLNAYIASDADTEMANDLWGYFATITKGTVKDNIDFRMTDIGRITKGDPPPTAVFYLTDDTVGVNFGYKLDWIWSFDSGNPRSMTRESSIFLKYEIGAYRIWKISDDKLFSYENNLTNSWE